MNLDRDTALKIFQKVKEIREAYKLYILGANLNKLSVMDFKYIIEEKYSLEITMTQVAYSGQFIRGLMERHDDNKLVVRVKQEQPADWKRFTAVKEMCHGIIDEEEYWSPLGTNTIADLLLEYSVENGDVAHPATQSEAFAEIAAIEIMYPYDVRASDLEKVTANETTYVVIATEHGIPANMIARALSQHYRENIADPIWAEVNLP